MGLAGGEGRGWIIFKDVNRIYMKRKSIQMRIQKAQNKDSK